MFKRYSLFITVLILYSFASYSQTDFDVFEKRIFSPSDSFTEITEPTGTPDVTLELDLDSVINPVRSYIFGNNSASFMGNLTSRPNRMGNWKNANHKLIRYPGGNISNRFFWDGNVPNNLIETVSAQGTAITAINGSTDWMLNPDEFPHLLDSLNAEGIVCVNSGYARYGGANNELDRIKEAAHYAAEWVRYYNITLGLDIKFWEIGNEDYGRWQMGHLIIDDGATTTGTPKIINGKQYLESTGDIYGQICNIFADSMKAADPSINIGAVCFENPGGLYNDNWNELLIPELNSNIDFLIVHQYFHPSSNKNNINEDDMYDAIVDIGEDIEQIHDLVESNGYERNHFPLFLTEYNQRGGTREISRTNALFASMCLGELVKYNYGAALMWDLENGYDGDNSDNGSPDDHGMTAKNDPCLNDGDMNPSGYAHYFYSKYFGDTLINSTVNDEDIYSYATTFSSGQIGLVIVNTNPSSKLIDIKALNGTYGSRMYYHTITGDGDFDRTCYINGQGPENPPNGCENGVSGPQDYTSVLPISMELNKNNSAFFTAPEYSVSYITFEMKEPVITGSTGTNAIEIKNSEYMVSPNPTINEFSIHLPKSNQSTHNALLFNEVGQRLKTYSFSEGPNTFGSELKSGVYRIQIYFNDEVITQSLLKL